ncbi:MAG: carbohydrate ABC transporter permease [Planctomycetota bacterium]|nr:carbohydrate ABC transporter permease [Planctomycetota bacterium]
MAPRTHSRSVLSTVLVYALLVTGVGVVVFPMIWLLYTSLKRDRDIFLDPFSLPAWNDLQWANFTNAWRKGHFGEYFLNSTLLTIGTVALTVLLSAMAAYAISRFRFRGARPAFFYFLAGLMVPLQLAIVPLFFEMKSLGLLDSRLGLLVVYVAFGMPFSIFVLTGFFKTLPASLHEAALLDGAGEWGAFWRVMLPLARSGLITVGIFTFLGTWNEFLMAFMFLSGRDSEAIRTLPLGLAEITMASQYRSDWGMAFAGLVLMMAPTMVVYVVLQKHLIKGITVGAVKG